MTLFLKANEIVYHPQKLDNKFSYMIVLLYSSWIAHISSDIVLTIWLFQDYSCLQIAANIMVL